MTQAFTKVHTTYPIIVPGVGDLQCTTRSSRKTNDGKTTHSAKSPKAGGVRREKRNYRINGEDRGAFPSLASATKYVRSGGPERHAQRVARNILRQARLKSNAERRLAQTDRRYDRRILKAAEHFIDAVE